MKHIIITILFLNITPILPEEILKLRPKNSIAYIYEEPNLKSKKISKITEILEFSHDSLKIKLEQPPTDSGYWVQLRKPNGWIFTKEIIFDIENEDNCNDSLQIPSKLFLEGIEVIILKDGFFLISSNELGSSFNQQVGVWKSKKDKFEGFIYFEESTMNDCLNICFENEDTSNCKKSCKKEATKEFGTLAIRAKINFLLRIKGNQKILVLKSIKDLPKNIKSFFQSINIEENKLYKTQCNTH